MPTKITLEAVKSSLIAALGYDEPTGTLAVQFVKGGTYHYKDVPQDTYAALAGAESVGKAFGALIRPTYKGEAQEENADEPEQGAAQEAE